MAIEVERTITHTFLSRKTTNSGLLLRQPRYGIYIEKQEGNLLSTIFLEKEDLERAIQFLTDRISGNWNRHSINSVYSKIDIPKGWDYIE